MGHEWTEAEKEFVRKNAAALTDREIAVVISKVCGEAVSHQAVARIRTLLGLVKKRGGYRGLYNPGPSGSQAPPEQ